MSRLLLLSFAFLFSVSALADRPFTVWEKIKCGDIVITDGMREARFKKWIESAKSFSDGLNWQNATPADLTEYSNRLTHALMWGVRISRNATSPQSIESFRQYWARLIATSVPVEDFELSVNCLIEKQSTNPAVNAGYLRALLEDYRIHYQVVTNFSMERTPLAAKKFFDVNDLAFRKELEKVGENSSAIDPRFKGIVELEDGDPKRCPVTAKLQELTRNSLTQTVSLRVWLSRRNRIWFSYLREDISRNEGVVLSALESLNYDALKFMTMGRVTDSEYEIDLHALAELLDELSTYVRHRQFFKDAAYNEVIMRSRRFAEIMITLPTYSIHKSSGYYQALQRFIATYRTHAAPAGGARVN